MSKIRLSAYENGVCIDSITFHNAPDAKKIEDDFRMDFTGLTIEKEILN